MFGLLSIATADAIPKPAPAAIDETGLLQLCNTDPLQVVVVNAYCIATYSNSQTSLFQDWIGGRVLAIEKLVGMGWGIECISFHLDYILYHVITCTYDWGLVDA